jgi:iron-sulfur cluster assembly protein
LRRCDEAADQRRPEGANEQNTEIAERLTLPPAKIRCSVPAEDAIKAAIADYRHEAAELANGLGGAGEGRQSTAREDERKIMAARPQPISVTPAALEHVKALLARRGKPSAGMRIGIRARGCSGMSYTLEYADEKKPLDEVVETDGVTILIDPNATMFILGTEMDYVEDKLESGFVFRNPNEKGRCGCGESFHV